ncbi:MAG: response regulator [Lentisphaeria bacterium]|nr:response regulator [Lentisphaeria bacterium]
MDTANLQILLIEDNTKDFVLFEKYLNEGDYHLTHATSLENAARELEKKTFDILFLDLNLTDSSGIETLDKITETVLHNTPIVILTCLSDEEIAIKAVRKGAQDYLIKSELNSSLLLRSLHRSIVRKKAENELIQANKLASVGMMAGGIAHDFNNLLAVILGYSEFGIKQSNNQLITNYFDAISRASNTAKQLTQELLIVSRNRPSHSISCNLNSVLVRMKESVLRILSDKIKIDLNPQTNLWNILIDESQIDRIILNLCLNARDAMPEGGVIQISTENLHFPNGYIKDTIKLSTGNYVKLVIKDTGEGISNLNLEKIFDPFFTTKSKSEHAGTGLGLSITHGAVTEAGGQIGVESHVDEGTSFNLYFPIHGEDNIDIVNVPVLEKIQDKPSYKILIVDDNQDLLDMFNLYFEDSDYHVQTESNPLKVLKGDYAYDVDILVTDILMPHMNGKEFAKLFQEKFQKTDIIFISGYSKEILTENDEMLNTFHFLCKPFKPDDLLAKIQEILDGHKLNQ